MARSRLDIECQGETLPLEKRLIAFGNSNLCGDFGNSRRVCRQLNFSASVAMERMANEIRLANGIDDAGSVLAASPGKLKLDTTDSFGSPAAIEFFLSGTGIFVKEGSGAPEALTASSTEITSLIFNKITSSSVSKAVKISLIAKAKGSRMEKTENFYNTAILRGSY